MTWVFSDIDSLKQKADELDQQLEKLTDKMEEIITAQSQALDNIEPFDYKRFIK
jgi:uncharacterized coiled-coil DUF342 family protein